MSEAPLNESCASEMGVSEMGTSQSLLSIESLCIRIAGREIIKNLSLRIEGGEIVGLIGASGSGKSMTALAVMRLLPATAIASGKVVLRDSRLSSMDERQLRRIRGRDMGMVFQEPLTALNPMMRVVDQVAETVRLHQPASRARARAAAREALSEVGLTDARGILERYPHELSGGQRQRVAIALAIVLRPALLIADEPTTALDVASQAQILTLLYDLARSRGMSLILVSHDLAVIAAITDRIAVMSSGEIIEEGATRALRQMRHPYVQALLRAAEPLPRPLRPTSEAVQEVLDVRDIVREYSLERRSLFRGRPVLRAVDGASLTIRTGETVAVVGESGSGKSSLLRVILALDRPQSGEVRLLGESFSSTSGDWRRQRRSIQAVFQDPYDSFDPQWTVERIVAEPFFLMDAPPSAMLRRQQVAAVLEQVGLSSTDADRRPHEFSGGERQRIAIARALITLPAVIVFDEAVSALDVLVRAQVLELLAELSRRLRLAYLFVSHDLQVVRAIADRVYVMQQGRIVESGVTSTVFASPVHAHTRALIAAMPLLPAAC